MHKISISATELKNKVSEILNEVYFEDKITVVERYGKPIVKIVPIREDKARSREELKKALDHLFGAMPDFPDVTKFRVSRRRRVSF